MTKLKQDIADLRARVELLELLVKPKTKSRYKCTFCGCDLPENDIAWVGPRMACPVCKVKQDA